MLKIFCRVLIKTVTYVCICVYIIVNLNIFHGFMLMLSSMSIALPFLIALYNTTKFLATLYCPCMSGPLLCGLKMIKSSVMPVWSMQKSSVSMWLLSCPTVPCWPHLSAPCRIRLANCDLVGTKWISVHG